MTHSSTMPAGKWRIAKRVMSALTLLSIGCWSTRAHADEPSGKAYPVRLSYAGKVNERFDFTNRVSQELITSISSAPPGSKPVVDTTGLVIEGVIQTLAIDSKGQPTKFSLTIRKFVRTDGKDTGPVLPAGTVVIVDSSRATADNPDGGYAVANVKLSPAQLDALGLVTEAPKAETPTDDECYGTDVRQKIGASWPINVAKASKQPILDGWSASPEHTKGNSKLRSVDRINGNDWMTIEINILSDKGEGPVPPQAVIEKANLQIKMVGSSPLPATSGEGTLVTEVNTETIEKHLAPDGSQSTSHQTSKYRSESRSTPLAAGK